MTKEQVVQQQPIGGDVGTVKQQNSEHQVNSFDLLSTRKTEYILHLSIVAGLVVRHGDL